MTLNRRLTILQHNVQSWTTNKHNLTNAYRQIDPDIILLNSHGQTSDHPPIKIHTYTTYQTNKLDQPHAGAAIAIKNSIKHSLQDNYDTDVLTITVQTKTGPLDISTSYIPPRTGFLYSPDYYKLLNVNRQSLLIADLNARHPAFQHRDSNMTGRQLNDLLLLTDSHHIGPYFPTFLKPNSATSPDIIVTNKYLTINTHSRPGPMTASDHLPIVLTVSTDPILIPIKPRPSYKQADWDGYSHTLSNHPTIDLQNKTLLDIDNAIETVTKQIQDASKQFIPTVHYRPIPYPRQNDDIRRLTIEHDALYNHTIQYGHNVHIYHRLLTIRQLLRDKMTELYKNSWDETIHNLDVTRETKDFWKTVARLQGNSRQRPTIHLRDHYNNPIDSDEQIEQIFRQYWERTFTITDEDRDKFDRDMDRTATDETIRQSIAWDPLPTVNYHSIPPQMLTTEAEIKYLIQKSKQSAPGTTGITRSHLQHLPDNIIRSITNIYNALLTTGYFPDQWKVAIMIFLLKTLKSPYLHTNYRPISLLNTLGKIYERIVNIRTYNSLTDLNLHNPRQHGFQKNRSTITAIATLTQFISIQKSKPNQKVNLVLRDLSKAFDRVWHTGLLYKLSINQFPLFLLRTIHSFLHNRTAHIRINSITGPAINIYCGVPQGSPLSPTLFNFFTHDLPLPLPNTEHIAYADDITQIISAKSERRLQQLTQHAINQINQYEHIWKITTNTSKFTIVPISYRPATPVRINNNIIPFSPQGGVLGLRISSTGYHNHISKNSQTAKIRLTKLYRFNNLNPSNKRKLYNAFVDSALLYPTIPLHSASKSNISRLQKIQNGGTRFITGHSRLDRLTSEQLHRQANMLPVNQRLHDRAKNTWQKYYDSLDVQTQIKLNHPRPDRAHRSFPDVSTGDTPTPPPIYL